MKITLIQPGKKKKKKKLHKLLFDTGLIYFIFINHLFKILNKSARQLCHLSASSNWTGPLKHVCAVGAF